ncbi:MAG: Crp/Fnr family transcriptional regulator [Tagaea sp.]|nr:Crp/Fnr family transcriptional regulator [Tagaea sp.]
MTGGWIARVPALARLEPETRRDLEESASIVRLADAARLFSAGEPCRNFAIVLAGMVRVQLTAESGREVKLYDVGPGGTCILTTACLLGGNDYAAEALAEGDVDLAAIPRAAFERAMERSAAFRRFALAGFGERLGDLMRTFEAVAFERVGPRLARLLLARARDGAVETTHQALAAELGSAREVVSRNLKNFERQGWVALERGSVRLLDAGPLESLASAHAV